ncbi:MAG TPA: Hsp20 family protein [Noviherbaspirillum sp.]|uniref:Hsp20 family protein n=1 Tax=Noviherbaspirillum sp. TaxID=1926288 RepID=UPI002B49E9CB|nr:Hsp20 family protein [Noviherbaspirillum sp.]HJV86026.1 Hsp20 family protein [Noviherbaspirillum sp.]
MARIERSVEVNVPPRTAYDQLMQFEHYPRFLDDVKEVRQVDDTHLHWHVRSGNTELEWDAEITQQVPERCIAWRNINGPRYEGKVELHEDRPGCTRVTLTMECDPKQQVLAQHGDAGAMILQRAEHELGRFKKFMEQLEQQSGGTGGKAAAQAGRGVEERKPEQRGQVAGARGGQVQQGERKPEQMQAWLPDLFQVWDGPFTVMRRMSQDMDRLFERFMNAPALAEKVVPAAGTTWSPPVETAQRENRFIVCAELAGVKRDDLLVEISSNRLTIEGERHPEAPHAPQEYRRSERAYGHFYRVIDLPPGANTDAASASMQDGVLEVTVPIERERVHGRRLEIQTPH